MSREEAEAKEVEEAKKEKQQLAPNPRLLTMQRAGRQDQGEKGRHYHAWALTGESTDSLTFTCIRCKDQQGIPRLSTSADTEP